MEGCVPFGTRGGRMPGIFSEEENLSRFLKSRFEEREGFFFFMK
jgi:hypothetical protein